MEAPDVPVRWALWIFRKLDRFKNVSQLYVSIASYLKTWFETVPVPPSEG